MLNIAKWSHNVISNAQTAIIGLGGDTMIIKKYSGSDIDELTGDPVDASSRSCTQYKVPILISETEDYRSKVDSEYTNELIKNIRVLMSPQNRVLPSDEDIFVVKYGGTERSYRAISIKWIGNRIQIDLKEIDQKIS